MKYCVFKKIAQNITTADRGCATADDMDFKKFHEIKGIQCIKCIGDNCKNATGKGDIAGDLERGQLVCFCKTDECNNQCKYNQEIQKSACRPYEPFDIFRNQVVERCNASLACSSKTDEKPENVTIQAPSDETVTDGNGETTEANGNGVNKSFLALIIISLIFALIFIDTK